MSPDKTNASDFKYWAFISYSHADDSWARWLHRKLETCPIPRSLVGQPLGDEKIPARLFPIFRDRDELPGSADLNNKITEALRQSRNIIVICSPRSAASQWVDGEIRHFKSLGRSSRVFCLIVGGEPYAADKPDCHLEECFPKPIKFNVDSNGELLDTPAEPIAADARPGKDGRHNALLKLMSGLLDVGFDALKQRDQERRLRRLRIALSVGAALAIAFAVLSVFAAIQAQQAKAAAELARINEEHAVINAREADQARIKAESAEQLAKQEARTAKAVADFLSGLFEDADPIARHGGSFGVEKRIGPEITAKEVVDQSADRLRDSLHEDPKIRALLLDKIGNVYLSLTLPSEAAPLIEESLKLRRDIFGNEHVETANSLHTLGVLKIYTQDFAEAGRLLEEALRIHTLRLGRESVEASNVLLDQGVLAFFENDAELAKECLTRSLELRRKLFGSQSREALACLVFLSVVQTTADGDISAAQEAAQVWDALTGSDDFGSFMNLAIQAALMRKMQDPGADNLFQAAEKKGVELLGDKHLFLTFLRSERANFLHKISRHDEARRIATKGIENLTASLGPDCIYLPPFYQILASVERDQGNHEKCAEAAREALRINRAFVERRDSYAYADSYINSCRSLSRFLLDQEEYEEAIRIYSERLIIEKKADPDSSVVAPSGLVVSLLAGTDNPIERGAASRQIGRRRPKRAFNVACRWGRAANVLTARSPAPDSDRGIVIDSLVNGALATLAVAIKSGFRDLDAIMDSPDLKLVRVDERFAVLSKSMKRLGNRQQ